MSMVFKRGLVSDQPALLELLNRDEMIIVEQPVSGKTKSKMLASASKRS